MHFTGFLCFFFQGRKYIRAKECPTVLILQFLTFKITRQWGTGASLFHTLFACLLVAPGHLFYQKQVNCHRIYNRTPMFIFVILTEFFLTETNSKMDFVAWVFKREIVILHLPYQQNENEEQSGKGYGKSLGGSSTTLANTLHWERP